jgi:hypothetical protein
MRAMWFTTLMVAAVGCSSSHSALDASMDRVPCEAAYQASLDRACTVPTDCGLTSHEDCCGTVKIAVRSGTESAALAAEATYAACFDCGARGCFHADLAEDGAAPQAGQAIIATCVANRCVSVVQ